MNILFFILWFNSGSPQFILWFISVRTYYFVVQWTPINQLRSFFQSNDSKTGLDENKKRANKKRANEKESRKPIKSNQANKKLIKPIKSQ